MAMIDIIIDIIISHSDNVHVHVNGCKNEEEEEQSEEVEELIVIVR